MLLVTKNIIRRILSDIATAHYQINSFGYGQLHELPQLVYNEDTQTMADRRRYPILFAAPDLDTIQGKTIYYGYKIVIADLVRTGEQNETEVESDTFLIIQDVIAQLQQQDYGFLLDMDNIQIEPFTERFADLLTGHIATIRLKTGYEFNRCQIPMDFISISNPYIPLDEEGTNERDPLSWHKTGNTLTTSSTLGSNNDQDWRIIHNNVTIGTVQATGLTINGAIDYTTGAIQSLNGLTDKVQTFAIGSSGTDFNLVSAAGVHTFNIPDAGVGITGGLVNNAAQTFEGAKTFASAPILTGFTQGSVLFAGVGGVVSQDNPNFKYDSTARRLTLGGTLNVELDFNSGANAGRITMSASGLLVGTLAGLPLTFYTGASEKGRFTSSGQLLVGNTTGSGRLNVWGAGTTSATWTAQFHNSSGANNAFIINDAGQLSSGVLVANASAKLQLDSTSRGFLPPRMTTAQKNAIATPAAGLVVYDTTLNKLCVYTAAWETITSV